MIATGSLYKKLQDRADELRKEGKYVLVDFTVLQTHKSHQPSWSTAPMYVREYEK